MNKDKNDNKKESHESYGVIGCSRVTGTGRSLFGSSIKHNNSIMLRIKTAEKERSLSNDYYFGRKTLIEVEMSPTQFAEMITSLNVGDGIPCTIRRIDGVSRCIADPPEVKQRQVFEAEFEESISRIKNAVEVDFMKACLLLNKKGNLTIKDRRAALGLIRSLINTLADSMPFIQKQFNEAMDKTVNEAKGEVEAFVMGRVTSLGLERMVELGEVGEARSAAKGEITNGK